MNKLLCANFARLKRSKCFWISLAVMLMYALIFCLSNYHVKVRYGHTVSLALDSIFFAPYIMVGILIAVFCSTFIGTEYSDGTIRNKLIVGHSRYSVYHANFITSFVAGLVMNLVYLTITCALGIPLLGFFETGLQVVMLTLLAGMLLTIAFASIFTLLSMLNQNKALAATLSILCIFAALILSLYMYNRIRQPEFIQRFSLLIDGVEHSEQVPNPAYLNDSQRAVFQFVMDFFPTGQAVELAGLNASNLKLMPLYSIVIIAITNTVGIFFFRRKDLK